MLQHTLSINIPHRALSSTERTVEERPWRYIALFQNPKPSFISLCRLFSSSPGVPFRTLNPKSLSYHLFSRPQTELGLGFEFTPNFRCFSTRSSARARGPPKRIEFSDSEDENESNQLVTSPTEAAKRDLPPPYDPFSKKPVVEEPEDPKNLQGIFHKMRTEGLTSNAIKMFDFLSRDGRTHEALELFAVIKDKGNMPDVVAHTAVIEAYTNAGQPKEGLKVYLRMLAAGVRPNAYTYHVLIRGLAAGGQFKDLEKHLIEMMEQGIRPGAATYVPVFEAFCRAEKAEEAQELLGKMKTKGFAPEEEAVREQLGKRGQVFRSVMNLLFGE